MNYTDEDIDNALDKLLIERGEHPTRVRNPVYGEERDLAKKLLNLFITSNIVKLNDVLSKANENKAITDCPCTNTEQLGYIPIIKCNICGKLMFEKHS